MSYIDIVKHYEGCFKVHGDNHKGVDWPKEEDVKTRYEVMLEVMKFDSRKNQNKVSILDFGCGLGHLYSYILEHHVDVIYAGLDASKLFVERCREKFSDVNFFECDLLSDDTEGFPPKYDYIIMNGVFTEKETLSQKEMMDYFQKLVMKVYAKCNYGIAFNVMSKDVDWEREDLFHLPLNELSSFLTKNITRDFIIRNDYGLYEYTVYVYRR